MTKGKIDLTIKADELTEQETKLPICGIIMPIANTDGYPDGHWSDVYEIICQAAKAANFTPNLVSFDDDIGVIQKRIVQNIYDNPIVVCDISSRNANVMFELGMRLAFDKPTIIIKDDKTPYSFDISPIEHLEYPSDLRYQSINAFQNKLKNKIIETHSKANNDPDYTTFLKHFGTFKVAKLDEKEVSGTELVIAEIAEIRNSLSLLIKERHNKNYNKDTQLGLITPAAHELTIPVTKKMTDSELQSLTLTLQLEGESDFTFIESNNNLTIIFSHPLTPAQKHKYTVIASSYIAAKSK
ncbi:TPA: hypothetical protein ON538_003464 [Morganella morganii]|nr:hypothetical protein [Morganella morganii]